MTSLGFTQLAQPASNPPPATVARGAASVALDYYVNGVGGSVRAYKRTGSTWAWLATTALTFPFPNGMQMSPDGAYIACGSNASTPGHGIYSFNPTTGAVAACTLTGTAIGSVTYGVSWHPSSNYVAIAVGAGGTPTSVIAIFKKVNSTTWNLLTTLAKAGAGTGVSWNKDGTRLVGHGNSSPWLEVWNFNSGTDTFTAVSGTPVDTQPGSNIFRGFAHNPIDDTLVCLRSTGVPGFSYFAYEPTANSGNGQYQKKADTAEASGTQANYGSFPAWTPDGKHLFVPLSVTPWCRVYDYDLTTKTLTLAANQITDFTAATFAGWFETTNYFAAVGTGAKFYTTKTLANNAMVFPAFTMDASAGQAPPIDATIVMPFPTFGLAATLKQTNKATIAEPMPAFSMAANLTYPQRINASIAFPSFGMSSLVLVPIDATIAMAMPSFVVDALGSQPEPIDATIAMAFPKLVMAIEEWFYLSVGANMPMPAFSTHALLNQPGPIDANINTPYPAFMQATLVTFPISTTGAMIFPSFTMDAEALQLTHELTANMDFPLFDTSADVFVTLPPIDATVGMLFPAFRTSTKLGYQLPEGAAKLAGIRANIKAKGRAAQFVKRGQLIDSNSQLGSALDGDLTEDTYVVQVYPSGVLNLGLSKQKKAQFDECDKIMIVAPPENGEDLTTYDYVVDAGVNWEIVTSETLQPGAVALLYYIGTKRS
jgi:hypothetical protein